MRTQEIRPKHTDGFMARDLGDEYLFYDRRGDQVHVLNGTAREIYILCDGTRSPEDVAGGVVEKFDIDPATALSDVKETVEQLIGLGLLQ